MSSIWIAALVLTAAPADAGENFTATSPPTASASARGSADEYSPLRRAHQLREAVARQLRREAVSERGEDEAENEAAIRALVALHAQLAEDTALTTDERTHLMGVIRSRMLRVESRLEQRAERRKQTAGRGGAAADDYGPELVELIQTVIAPQSWAVHGGPGTMRYYRPSRVLVIRQTSEVHEQLGGVLRQMRK
jgi:hypothetical protein